MLHFLSSLRSIRTSALHDASRWLGFNISSEDAGGDACATLTKSEREDANEWLLLPLGLNSGREKRPTVEF